MTPTASGKGPARRRILVTAGPTREYLDPVRYLTNESSGRMGFAIAAAAAARGHRVTLVAGPCALATPAAVRRVDVVTARDMLAACREAFEAADALFMSAAVCDWRPRRRLAGKWRAKDGGADTTSLALVRNPDIVATLARKKAGRLVCGFALETADGRRRAEAKRVRKHLDYVVLNDERALNARTTSVTILGPNGYERTLPHRSKDKVAHTLITLLDHPRPT